VGSELEQDLRSSSAVADDDHIAARLQAVEGGTDLLDSHRQEREVAIRGFGKGPAAPGAEIPPHGTEPAAELAPADGDVGDYVTAAAIRTSHMTHQPLLRRILPGAVVLLAALTALSLPALSTAQTRVYPGVDVLLSGRIDFLAGKRIGLITHRAATGIGGWPTATLLGLDPRIRVVALFAPEHGLSGTLPAGARVPSSEGSIPVYSLYSDTLRPTSGMLAGIDALVFDLQDVGTRAYTYISTMALAMQAAAENNKLFVVLDRPNPLGGERIDGPVLDRAFASFIGIYPVPAVHGMTIGELAMLFNREFGIGANLVVVPMAGWQASMQWDDTGLSWFRPSPMIQSPAVALLHAATGVMEGTNLSVGAGTNVPFETVTARGVRGDLLAERLNRAGIPGVWFAPQVAGTADRRTGGIRLLITDPRQFLPATAAVYIMTAIRDLHPGLLQFVPSGDKRRYLFDLVWGTDAVRRALIRGASAESIVASWQDDLQRFEQTRQRYLLYTRSGMVIAQTTPQPVIAEVAAIKTQVKPAAPKPTARRTQLPACRDRPVICGGLAGAGVIR